MLPTASNAFNTATYFNERSILSFWILSKIYFLNIVSWVVPYLIAYLVWCHYLNYNWPIPLLGYNYMIVQLVLPATLWASFHRDLRIKEIFRKSFPFYILYIAWALVTVVVREQVSNLFEALPGYLQWIVAFLIPLLKYVDEFIYPWLVKRMPGGQEESSKVLLEFGINTNWTYFIAVKLSDANLITVFLILTVDFVQLLQITYKIFRLHNRVNDTLTANQNIDEQRMITSLAVVEITEVLTPIVYAIGFAMAYYGYNGAILGDVKNSYWGYNMVDDIGHFFEMMLLLFCIDTFFSIFNSILLSTLADINLFQEISRVLKRYWHFIAIKFSFKMLLMFSLKDINMGMDSTGEYKWITNDGRNELINASTELSYEEKLLLLKEGIL